MGLLAEAWGTAWRKARPNATVIALRQTKSPASVGGRALWACGFFEGSGASAQTDSGLLSASSRLNEVLPLQVRSHTLDKKFFFAGRVTQASPVIGFDAMIARSGPAVDEQLSSRVVSGSSRHGKA